MARKKATVVTKKTGTVKTAPVKAETVKKTEPMKKMCIRDRSKDSR